MQREIKFRLRDFANRIVGYEKWYEGAFDNETLVYTAKPQWLYSSDGKHWNPEPINHRFKDQYSGWEDKSEISVFKGDILKRFKKNGTAYKSLSYVTAKNDPFWGLDYLHEKKVIGNIYSNPELLKN